MNIKLVAPTRLDYHKVDELLLQVHNKHVNDYPALYNELDNSFRSFIYLFCLFSLTTAHNKEKK